MKNAPSHIASSILSGVSLVAMVVVPCSSAWAQTADLPIVTIPVVITSDDTQVSDVGTSTGPVEESAEATSTESVTEPRENTASTTDEAVLIPVLENEPEIAPEVPATDQIEEVSTSTLLITKTPASVETPEETGSVAMPYEHLVAAPSFAGVHIPTPPRAPERPAYASIPLPPEHIASIGIATTTLETATITEKLEFPATSTEDAVVSHGDAGSATSTPTVDPTANDPASTTPDSEETDTATSTSSDPSTPEEETGNSPEGQTDTALPPEPESIQEEAM